MSVSLSNILLIYGLLPTVWSFHLLSGKWAEPITVGEPMITTWSMFEGTTITVRVACDISSNTAIDVKAILEPVPCTDFILMGKELKNLEEQDIFKNADPKYQQCSNNNHVEILVLNEAGDKIDPQQTPFERLTRDGIYLIAVNVSNHADANSVINGVVHFDIKGPDGGYLSAAEWPLLRFYSIMCLVYLVYAISWLFISFMKWRELLKIQFWIGAVICIGMVEKALFYYVYESKYNGVDGSSIINSIYIAEVVSAAKRSLARILVIIVSLGYGIVKPRLGAHFPRIISTGVIYFVLATFESHLRIAKLKGDTEANYIVLGYFPLALLDSMICWWILSSLVQTTRTLRLRRNLVKLSLFNRFSNILIFAVVASAVFMTYSIKTHQLAYCLSDWKMLWLDEAFWHILFSFLLLVIMILWRPTNNSQRYSFSPLLDAPDDEDDDEDIDHFVNESYNIKMRGLISNRSDSPRSRDMDEDLAWVEENIPSTFIEKNIVDSEDELVNTKFEISKMQ